MFDVAKEDPEFGSCGDVSTFTYSRVFISEAAVDEHIRLPYGSYTRMYKKHVGTFVCPSFTTPVLNESRDAYVDGPMTDPRACSAKLDEYFYGARLGDYFNRE
jgi:hypothetical protein